MNNIAKQINGFNDVLISMNPTLIYILNLLIN